MADVAVAPQRETPTGDETAADAAMGRYADGHDDAFPAVHAALASRLHTYLLRMTRNPARADDLLQETFLRIHRARASFARGAKLLPWGYAVARNVYIDETRSARSRNEVSAPDDATSLGDRVPTREGDGEEALVAKELATVVERTLAGLPQNQREAFVLLRYEGLSVADAATILGATDGAVKLRAFHAYEALRAALAAPRTAPRKGAR